MGNDYDYLIFLKSCWIRYLADDRLQAVFMIALHSFSSLETLVQSAEQKRDCDLPALQYTLKGNRRSRQPCTSIVIH